MAKSVVLTGAFDDLHSRDVRIVEEAAKLGPVTLLLFSDELIRSQTGSAPKFPWLERLYLVKALRFIHNVFPLETDKEMELFSVVAGLNPGVWVETDRQSSITRRQFCSEHSIDYRVFSAEQLAGFPELLPSNPVSFRKKVIVTGCYDWMHSGHVRFFEEVSTYGDLYVVIGHDANIRLLKGEGHPLLRQEERRYMVGSIRYVTQALVSSGSGWLDAEPEIQRIKPDIYAVNEDGDRGGKREYCARAGLEYLVLKRIPAPGLPARSSTNLRGF